MEHPFEPRINDIIKRWDQADELYYGIRYEAEQAIQEYEEMEKKYEEARYFLFEAEERIAELEEEIRLLRESEKQTASDSVKTYVEIVNAQEER